MWETIISLAFNSMKEKYFHSHSTRETDEILAHKCKLRESWKPALVGRHLTKSGLAAQWSPVRTRLRAGASPYSLPADVDPRAELL